MSKKYKCPYCENRLERDKLIVHVSKNHGELIPHGMFPEQVVFNSINKTNGGKCRVCGKPTPWNQKAGRYDVLCGNPACKEKMREDYKRNMLRVRGTYNILNDPEQQEKMLANRSISGKYRFQDGGEVSYTGSYEKKCLEFMDIVMQIPSKDILSPGPTMEYEYNGEKHIYIPDFYYIPYNLIIEVKDGGKNPNRKSSIGMDSSREKTIEKERLVTDRGEYNYIRLTDNDFAQLITIFMQIKYKLLTGDFTKTININESEIIQESLKTDKYYRVSVDGVGIYQALKMKVGWYDFKEISKSPNIKWLPKPPSYYSDNYSLFTNYGFTVFKQRTLPIMLKYFKPEEIKIEENIGYPGKLVYKDRFQVIVEIDRDLLEGTILESQDASLLDDSHITKPIFGIKYIDGNSISAWNYYKRYKTDHLYDNMKNYWLSTKNAKAVLAIDSKRDMIAGYACIRGNGNIQPIFVYPEYRGYGISNELMKIAIRDYGATKLGVFADNQIAIKLYKSMGFEEYKRKKYKDGSEAIMMKLNEYYNYSHISEKPKFYIEINLNDYLPINEYTKNISIDGLGRCKISIYEKEGDNEPHLHIESINPVYVNGRKKIFDGCIKLYKAEFFAHGKHKDTFNDLKGNNSKKAAESFNNFMNSKDKNNIQMWKVCRNEWLNLHKDVRDLSNINKPNYKNLI